MKNLALAGVMLSVIGCSEVETGGPSAEHEREGACPRLERADEMRINVMRSDERQMLDLQATFHYGDHREQWKCSASTLDGILCQAMPHMITIIAPLADKGEITAVELADPKGFGYSGDVSFQWTDEPDSWGCSRTYRRGVADLTLTQQVIK